MHKYTIIIIILGFLKFRSLHEFIHVYYSNKHTRDFSAGGDYSSRRTASPRYIHTRSREGRVRGRSDIASPFAVGREKKESERVYVYTCEVLCASAATPGPLYRDPRPMQLSSSLARSLINHSSTSSLSLSPFLLRFFVPSSPFLVLSFSFSTRARRVVHAALYGARTHVHA